MNQLIKISSSKAPLIVNDLRSQLRSMREEKKRLKKELLKEKKKLLNQKKSHLLLRAKIFIITERMEGKNRFDSYESKVSALKKICDRRNSKKTIQMTIEEIEDAKLASFPPKLKKRLSTN